VKFSMDDILLINAFEKISKVNAKDCITEKNVISFLVEGKLVGKAIGKKAVNVKFLEQKLKKKIEIIGFYKKPEEVIKKTFDVEIEEINKKKGRIIITVDSLNKRKIMNNLSRLKRVRELMKRNYELELTVN